MACGCAQPTKETRDTWRARAARCQFCFSAEHDSGGMWDGTAVACTILGLPIEQVVKSPVPRCPKGKHDDMQAAFGRRYFGLPAYFRFLMLGQTDQGFPGCGCDAKWKEAWLRFLARPWVVKWRRFWAWANGREFLG